MQGIINRYSSCRYIGYIAIVLIITLINFLSADPIVCGTESNSKYEDVDSMDLIYIIKGDTNNAQIGRCEDSYFKAIYSKAYYLVTDTGCVPVQGAGGSPLECDSCKFFSTFWNMFIHTNGETLYAEQPHFRESSDGDTFIFYDAYSPLSPGNKMLWINVEDISPDTIRIATDQDNKILSVGKFKELLLCDPSLGATNLRVDTILSCNDNLVISPPVLFMDSTTLIDGDIHWNELDSIVQYRIDEPLDSIGIRYLWMSGGEQCTLDLMIKNTPILFQFLNSYINVVVGDSEMTPKDFAEDFCPIECISTHHYNACLADTDTLIIFRIDPGAAGTTAVDQIIVHYEADTLFSHDTIDDTLILNDGTTEHIYVPVPTAGNVGYDLVIGDTCDWGNPIGLHSGGGSTDTLIFRVGRGLRVYNDKLELYLDTENPGLEFSATEGPCTLYTLRVANIDSTHIADSSISWVDLSIAVMESIRAGRLRVLWDPTNQASTCTDNLTDTVSHVRTVRLIPPIQAQSIGDTGICIYLDSVSIGQACGCNAIEPLYKEGRAIGLHADTSLFTVSGGYLTLKHPFISKVFFNYKSTSCVDTGDSSPKGSKKYDYLVINVEEPLVATGTTPVDTLDTTIISLSLAYDEDLFTIDTTAPDTCQLTIRDRSITWRYIDTSVADTICNRCGGGASLSGWDTIQMFPQYSNCIVLNSTSSDGVLDIMIDPDNDMNMPVYRWRSNYNSSYQTIILHVVQPLIATDSTLDTIKILFRYRRPSVHADIKLDYRLLDSTRSTIASGSNITIVGSPSPTGPPTTYTFKVTDDDINITRYIQLDIKMRSKYGAPIYLGDISIIYKRRY